jgi:membrane protease subunit HflC
VTLKVFERQKFSARARKTAPEAGALPIFHKNKFMKRNTITFTIGILLVLIFGALLFTFQVRQTEVALVTTFGKPTRDINTDPNKPEPGLYFKMPWPIQKVQKFDKRVQNFEDKFSETQTRDGKNILVAVYAGWTISNPKIFRERFAGSVQRAEHVLEGLINDAKNTVIGQHPFSNFISTNPQELKFAQIENEIRDGIKDKTTQYGININFLGIKKLGLPEAITQKVFDRMKEERNRVVAGIKAQGEAEASKITSAADRDRAEILSQADATAIEIRGKAEAEAAKSYKIFEQNPDLAIFLDKIKSLEESTKDRTSWILDHRTPPFDLLDGQTKMQSLPKTAATKK